LWEFIDALKDARDQLSSNAFQNELGNRLEMRKSTLSKWGRPKGCARGRFRTAGAIFCDGDGD